MRISRQLLLALLLVSLLPLLVAGAIVERAIRTWAENYAATRIHSDAGFTAEAIEEYLRDAESMFKAAGIAISARQGDKASWSPVLMELREIHPLFSRLRLIDPGGTVVASSEAAQIGDRVTDVPDQIRALFLTALAAPTGAVYFTDLGEAYEIYPDAAGRIRSMGLMMPIDDAEGRRVGVLSGLVDTRPILELLLPYLLEPKGTFGLEAFVVDDDDRVLFNHDKEQNVIGHPLAPEYREMLEGLDVDPPDARAPMVDLGGRKAYVSVASIGTHGANRKGGWRFVSVLPNQIVMEGINQGFMKGSMVLLMIVAAAFAAAFWVARTISRPIHALTSSAEAMAGGDYSTRAEQSRSIEVNQLARAFNRMADAVAAEKLSLETEIAERKQTQARADELQRSRELILDNAGDGLLGLDVDGRIRFVNPAGARLLGSTPVALVGQDACAVWCPDQPGAPSTENCPLDPERLVHDAGRPLQHVLRRGDTRLAVEYVVSPLAGQDGLSGAVLAFRDVRHRKAYEDQLEAARVAAETTSRAKSEFLANMSHEIRTPMNGVLGFTSLLLDTTLDDDQREHVETIRRSAELLLTIINDILDFSKVEAGRLSVERIPFDLGSAARDVIDLLAPEAEAKRIDLDLRISPEQPVNVIADPGRVRQVLVNLLGNALKFTRAGHVLIEIGGTAGRDRGGRDVRCTVSDTGIGIPHPKQAELFEPFTQADASTTREFGGTGLGLVISKRLVELMGGRIGFSSEPEVGSRFWFTLPAPADCVAAPVESTPRRSDDECEEIDDPLGDVHVLVAEDNDVNQRLIRRMLERLGCRVDMAANGLEATRKAAARHYHLVLMDCLMPEMDGYEATARLRADGHRMPIVALTANALPQHREECLAAGMDDYLSKPVRLHEIRALLLRWLPAAIRTTAAGTG